jgi:subtilisin family serine protease
MGEKLNIKYGNGSLELIKSDELVGVKLKVGASPQAITAYKVNAQTAGERLGGFRLVNVDDAPGNGAEETLEKLRTNGSVAVGTHVYHTSDDGIPFVPTGEIYVKFRDQASQDTISQIFSETQLQIVSARDSHRFIVRSTPQSPNPVKAAAELQRHDDVEIAEPDLATPRVARNTAIPADELVGRQWHLQNKGLYENVAAGYKKGADARVIAAWSVAETLGDPNIVIAIIDDGFDLDHPDLSGSGKVVGARDFTRNSYNPRPDFASGDWHGTACAGVAVGGANGTGIVGAAPRCSLMPVRWGPDLSDAQVEAWFAWVTQNSADVVSCSWGAAAQVYELSQRKIDAIADCAQKGRDGKGCVICFAAGNSNRDISDKNKTWDGFAVHPDVIAVSACTSALATLTSVRKFRFAHIRMAEADGELRQVM